MLKFIDEITVEESNTPRPCLEPPYNKAFGFGIQGQDHQFWRKGPTW